MCLVGSGCGVRDLWRVFQNNLAAALNALYYIRYMQPYIRAATTNGFRVFQKCVQHPM